MYDRPQDAEVGLYVEPHVTIENKGPRTATIESNDILSPEMPQIQTLKKVQPSPFSMVPGTMANHSVGNGNDYVRGYVEVGGQRLIARFNSVCDLLSVAGKILHPLKCKLTVRNTEGNTAASMVLRQPRLGPDLGRNSKQSRNARIYLGTDRPPLNKRYDGQKWKSLAFRPRFI
ncbi:MAG: hypothetical protein WCG81_06360 [Candidatus Angelobacter sp.]